jgi:hypothetical protein
VIKGKDPTTEVGSCSITSVPMDKQGVQSPVAIPSNSFVSLSQLWYTWRVKEKVVKLLNKNK